MKKCVFSVIMPCYNSEAYVAKAIESVVTQIYPYWELIIINDGSYDNTLNIVTDYAENNKRIKVFTKENGGYATAVNMGLDKISGDYFLFLGSDDYLAADLLQTLYEHIVKIDTFPDMIAFRTRKVIDGIVGNLDFFTNFDSFLFSKCTLKELINNHPEHAAIFSVRDTSRCYKRELLSNLRYFGKTGMDADGIFSMLMAHRSDSFLNIPIDGYFWVIRNDSVSASMSSGKIIDSISNWQEFFKTLILMDHAEITSTEKKYVTYYSEHIVTLAKRPTCAIKYWKLIISHARFAKKIAKILDTNVANNLNWVAKTPILFSLNCLLHDLPYRFKAKKR